MQWNAQQPSSLPFQRHDAKTKCQEHLRTSGLATATLSQAATAHLESPSLRTRTSVPPEAAVTSNYVNGSK